jgi:SAM-dependent methyltransferase
MSLVETTGFTAHNVRLDDGTYTFPQANPIDEVGNYVCVKNLLPLLYPQGWQGRSIVDLGCLEGGFATEFARLGLDSTGIDVRESNIANAEYIRARTSLPNLRFIRDDAWNLGRHGPFDMVFCVGLHYHIDDPHRFLQEMARNCRTAIFIDTHVAPEFDHEPAVETFKLSPLTLHEGLPGRWYAEHDLDAGAEQAQLETLKWASWENRRSFWPTRGGLVRSMREAGFAIVMQDFDQQLNWPTHHLSPDGWYYQTARAMFVGIKSDEAALPGAPASEAPPHRLDGRVRAEAPPRPGEAPALPADVEALWRTVEAVYASKSWKATAPLRAISRLLRR